MHGFATRTISISRVDATGGKLNPTGTYTVVFVLLQYRHTKRNPLLISLTTGLILTGSGSRHGRQLWELQNPGWLSASDNQRERGDRLQLEKTALVTGAGSGIGRASAIALAKSGFRVAICGRRMDALEETASLGGAEHFILSAVDVTDPTAVTALFDEIGSSFGRLDFLFNNAGRSAPAANIGDSSVNDWLNVVATNLNGAYFVAREAFIMMRDQSPQGGRIVNNGSISAHTPRPHAVAYNATKHAISGLTKSISLDGRAFSIAAGQIDIGNTATSMTEKMSQGMLQADGSSRTEPTFDVQHVADAVVFMANLPLNANVQTMTIMATNMPFVGRG